MRVTERVWGIFGVDGAGRAVVDGSLVGVVDADESSVVLVVWEVDEEGMVYRSRRTVSTRWAKSEVGLIYLRKTSVLE